MKVSSLGTPDYPYSNRLDVWQRVITDHLVTFRVLPAPGVAFRRRLCRRILGPVDVVVTTGTFAVSRRPQRMAAQISDRRADLSVHLSGDDWVVSEDRSQHRIHPGALILWDLSQPKTLAWPTPTCGASIQISVDALVPRSERLLSAATVLPTRGGLSALIEAYLRRLTGLAAEVPPDIASHLDRTTVDLLATYFACLLGETSSIDGVVRRTQLHQAKTHIETHLGESELCPATIAAAQHISVRLLYKLFSAEGQTVAGWIRKRRLEHVRHDLLNPRCASSSITAIAGRWGFVNSAHFSRVFKATYGASPSDYRRSCSHPPISLDPGIHF